MLRGSGAQGGLKHRRQADPDFVERLHPVQRRILRVVGRRTVRCGVLANGQPIQPYEPAVCGGCADPDGPGDQFPGSGQRERLGIGRADYCVNRAADVLGGAVGIGLAGIKPGNDGFQCHGRDEPGRPISKWTITDREVALGDVDRGGPDRVDNVAELRFSGCVTEQQPEPLGVRRSGAQQKTDGSFVVIVDANGGGQPNARAVEYRPVEVGLRGEVPVEDHVGNARFASNVIEARGGEAAAGECAGGSVEDLLAAFSAGHPPDWR
jgi:hypothetical protein